MHTDHRPCVSMRVQLGGADALLGQQSIDLVHFTSFHRLQKLFVILAPFCQLSQKKMDPLASTWGAKRGSPTGQGQLIKIYVGWKPSKVNDFWVASGAWSMNCVDLVSSMAALFYGLWRMLENYPNEDGVYSEISKLRNAPPTLLFMKEWECLAFFSHTCYRYDLQSYVMDGRWLSHSSKWVPLWLMMCSYNMQYQESVPHFLFSRIRIKLLCSCKRQKKVIGISPISR